MSRSNYSDDIEDQWQLIRWRGAVRSAIRGERGQRLLIELREALDAMPVKELIKDDLVDEEGSVCALGAVGVKRGVDMSVLDPEEYEHVASTFDIAPALAREIVWVNDEGWYGEDTPTERWQRVRDWVETNIKTVKL